VLEHLPHVGISIDNVTQQLEDQGVEKFTTAVRQAGGNPGKEFARACPKTRVK
jgi:hypothetical protein